MSLATRLSTFFVLALAAVLIGFSASLYLLARTYLVRQLDDRLQSALDTLEAAVDIEPGGLEWEPADRRIRLKLDPGEDEVRWTVRDDRGRLVDRSSHDVVEGFPVGWNPPTWPVEPSDGSVFGRSLGWRVAARNLRLEDLLRQGRGHPDDEPGYEVPYRALILVVGLSPAPVEAALNRLGLALIALSAAVGAAAAAASRWLCRRALEPVRRMARSATAMTAADLGQMLPGPGTGDELDELGRAFNGLLDRLKETFGRLNEANERHRRFAGDASHQLRTPLAALLGQVQLARRRERAPEEYRQVLDRVLEEGGRLRQIVDSLLFLNDPEGSPIELQTLDLASWGLDHLARWSEHPRAADLRLETDDGLLPVVRVHPLLLAQLLDNLIDNALKYSEGGSPVVVRLGREPGLVTLGVEDRGEGLPTEDRSRVFEPFYRTERARREGKPGVGIGLAVAGRIASVFGGSIEVRSQPGVGSLFLLRLPEGPAARMADGKWQMSDARAR